MDRLDKKTTIRLTLRLPDKLDQIIRDNAKKHGVSINQLLLSILNQWKQSHHEFPHNP